MESPIRTSFIPQQASKSPLPARQPRTGTIGIVTIVSVVIFVAAAVASGGLFFYQQYLKTTLQSKIDSLENAKGSFDLDLLAELQRIDTRMNAANKLLNQHVSLSSLFDYLEKGTLQSVRFQGFTFGAGSSVDSLSIKLEGSAQSFHSVALQSDEFSKAKIFNRTVFSGLNANDLGSVVFQVDAGLNKDEILFTKTIGESPDVVMTIDDITSELTSSNSDPESQGESNLDPSTTLP